MTACKLPVTDKNQIVWEAAFRNEFVRLVPNVESWMVDAECEGWIEEGCWSEMTPEEAVHESLSNWSE